MNGTVEAKDIGEDERYKPAGYEYVKTTVMPQNENPNYLIDSSVKQFKYDDSMKFKYTKSSGGWIPVTNWCNGGWSSYTFVLWYEPILYSLTYNADGGRFADGTTDEKTISSIKYGAVVDLITAPRKDGYRFTGWLRNDNVKYTSNFNMPSRNLVLTAQWQKLPEITINISGTTDTVSFNGSKQRVEGFTSDASSYRGVIVTIKDPHKAVASGIDAGQYMMGLKPEDFSAKSANYSKISIVIKNDGVLTIIPTKCPLIVTIKGNTDTVPYNGSEQRVAGFTSDASSYRRVIVTIKDPDKAVASGIDAGQYMMGLKPADFEVESPNYSNISVILNDGSLIIKPNSNPITVTIKGNTDTVPYNGSEQRVEGFISDAPEGVTIDYVDGSTAEAKGTDAGQYLMGLKAGYFKYVSSNYNNITIEIDSDGVLNITKLGADLNPVTVTSYNGTYDGTWHSITASAAQSGSKLLYSTDSTEIKNWSETAPEYKNVISAQTIYVKAENTNYMDSEGTGTLTITQAPLTVTTNSASKTYDGSALTASGSFTGLVNDETATFSVTGTQTAIGSSANSYSLTWNGTADANNYSISEALGTLTVNAAATGGGTTTTTTTTITTIGAAPVPAAATPAVLGATRTPQTVATPAVTEQPAVLGATRSRATGDTTDDLMRILIILICAGAASSVLVIQKKRRKQEKE